MEPKRTQSNTPWRPAARSDAKDRTDDGFDINRPGGDQRMPGVAGVYQRGGLPGRRPLYTTSTSWAQQSGDQRPLSDLLSWEHSRYSSSASSGASFGAPSYPQGRTDGGVGPNPVLSSLRSNSSSQPGSYPHSSGNTGPYASGGGAARYYPGQPPSNFSSPPFSYTPGGGSLSQSAGPRYQAPGFGARLLGPREELGQLTQQLADLAAEKIAADKEKDDHSLPLAKRFEAMKKTRLIDHQIEAKEMRKAVVLVEVSELPPPLPKPKTPPPPPNTDTTPPPPAAELNQFGIPIPPFGPNEPQKPDLDDYDNIQDPHTEDAVEAFEQFYAGIKAWLVQHEQFTTFRIATAKAEHARDAARQEENNRRQELDDKRDVEVTRLTGVIRQNNYSIRQIDDRIRLIDVEIDQVDTLLEQHLGLINPATSDNTTRAYRSQRATLNVTRAKAENEKNELERENEQHQARSDAIAADSSLL